MNELDEKLGVSEDVPVAVDSSDVQQDIVGTLVRENYGKIAVVLGMGTAAGIANVEHGSMAFVTAGLKQCAYSGVSAAVLLTFYSFLAKRVKTLPGELIPIVVPTLLTIAANYGVHSLRGTAEPMLSTLPTAITATLGFPIWHIRTRILELLRDIEDIEIKL